MGFIFPIISSIFFCYFIFKEIQEVLFLKRTLFLILGKKKIESTQDLIKLKNYLQSHISYTPKLRNIKRPFLRHTASQILQSKYGFCGENARVTIKLFKLGGIKAGRIYLFGKLWQHVLVEYSYGSKWFMFDGHYDPDTKLNDSQVGKIISGNISEYPNDYAMNPYLNFCRIKLFYLFLPLQFLSKKRLPSFIIYIFESPLLLKAFLILTIVLVLLTFSSL